MAGMVAFRPSEQDFVAVGRGSFRRSLGRRRFHVRVGIMAVIGAGAGLILSWLGSGVLHPGSGLIGMIAALLWLAVVILGSYLLIPRRTRRLHRQQRTANDIIRFSWDERTVTLDSENGRSVTAWSDYYDWYEDRVTFGFGLNERLFHFVPKRVLDAGQIDEIRGHADAFARHAI